MKKLAQALLVAALAVVGGLWLREQNAETVPQTGAEAETIRAILPHIKLPQGFRIELFAVVPDARHLAVSPDGGTVVVGTRGNRAYVIRNGGVRVLAPGLDFIMPNGPCFAPDGTLYVAEQNRIRAFPKMLVGDDTAQDIVPLGKLIPPEEQSGGHSARVCDVGPDNRLYVSLGQPYNVSPKEKQALYLETGIGGIIRYNRDGSGREVFATGLRNSVGLDFNPADGVLWFTDNQVDGMGDLIPPGEINRAPKAGLGFGFPWYGGGDTRTNEWKDESPPADAVFPEVATDAHAADLGLVFYSGTLFPEGWRGGLFSAQHGSWDRSTPIGARLLFTRLKSDGTAAETMIFAEGWIDENGSYRGRPVDVAVAGDGSLLVSDDAAGAIYRITSGP